MCKIQVKSAWFYALMQFFLALSKPCSAGVQSKKAYTALLLPKTDGFQARLLYMLFVSVDFYENETKFYVLVVFYCPFGRG